MAFELNKDEPLPEAMRRLAKAEIASAIAELSGKKHKRRKDAVHETRKSLKKLRAIARLLRPELGNKIYKKENVAFRDMGRALSSVRDADVALATFDKLVAKRGANAKFRNLRGALVRHRAKVRAEDKQAGDANAEVLNQLKSARKRIQAWPIEELDWETVEAGIEQAYKASRNALKVARKQGTSPAHHEWRKRVKYLWYQLRILRPIHPRMLDAIIADLKKVSESTGLAHDLTILRQTLDTAGASETSLAKLDPLIRAETKRLLAEARKMGEPVHAEKPKAFARRTVSCKQVHTSDIEC